MVTDRAVRQLLGVRVALLALALGLLGCSSDELPGPSSFMRSSLDADGQPGEPADRGPGPGPDRSLQWAQEQRLISSSGQLGDLMGWAAALDGDTAMVGVPSNPFAGTTQGSVLVFEQANGTWTQQQELFAPDGWKGDAFGTAVALQGDTALVGSTMDPRLTPSYPFPGAVYAFARGGTGWGTPQKLEGDSGAPEDTFGLALALDGDSAVVGAPFDDDNADNTGSVYVFTRNAGA